MRFWDASVLVPLLVEEESSRALRASVAEDPHILVSFITPVEIAGALARRSAEPEARQLALDLFRALEGAWTLIDEYGSITTTAKLVAGRHKLRAGDAFQLASALVVRASLASDLPFVTLDQELAKAARTEGFPTLP